MMLIRGCIMTRDKRFRIRSKKDAEHLADEIRHGKDLYYFLPLMGINGGTIAIQWNHDARRYTVSESCPGWLSQEDASPCDIIEYIWKDRKVINAHFHNLEYIMDNNG